MPPLHYSTLYALCSLRISDGSDFLPHKDEVTDAETEKGDRNDRDQVGDDDDEALQKGQWILEPG